MLISMNWISEFTDLSGVDIKELSIVLPYLPLKLKIYMRWVRTLRMWLWERLSKLRIIPIQRNFI